MPALNVYLTDEEYKYAKSCGRGYMRELVRYEMCMSGVKKPKKRRWMFWRA